MQPNRSHEASCLGVDVRSTPTDNVPGNAPEIKAFPRQISEIDRLAEEAADAAAFVEYDYGDGPILLPNHFGGTWTDNVIVHPVRSSSLAMFACSPALFAGRG
jgi:hypothetical protein